MLLLQYQNPSQIGAGTTRPRLAGDPGPPLTTASHSRAPNGHPVPSSGLLVSCSFFCTKPQAQIPTVAPRPPNSGEHQPRRREFGRRRQRVPDPARGTRLSRRISIQRPALTRAESKGEAYRSAPATLQKRPCLLSKLTRGPCAFKINSRSAQIFAQTPPSF